MEKAFRLFIYLTIVATLFACGKIELPTNDDDSQEKPGTGGQEQPDDGDFLTVSQLQLTGTGTFVAVVGYIVGYVPSGKISNAKFTAEDAVETNIVIADSPDESDPKCCAAVQLVKGSFLREALNLASYPENLHRCVCLFGTVQDYYGAPGLKQCEDFLWMDEEEDNGGEEDEPSDKPSVVFVPLLAEPAEVLVGD